MTERHTVDSSSSSPHRFDPKHGRTTKQKETENVSGCGEVKIRLGGYQRVQSILEVSASRFGRSDDACEKREEEPVHWPKTKPGTHGSSLELGEQGSGQRYAVLIGHLRLPDATLAAPRIVGVEKVCPVPEASAPEPPTDFALLSDRHASTRPFGTRLSHSEQSISQPADG